MVEWMSPEQVTGSDTLYGKRRRRACAGIYAGAGRASAANEEE